MAGIFQPLTKDFPIVGEDRRPTEYFIRWAQQRMEEIGQSITYDQAVILANELITAWSEGRTIATTGGIQGGGTLDADRSFSLTDTGVTPGAYTNADITIDAKGRITIAANGSGGGIPDAPSDGQTYGRNNAAWVVVSGGGGSTNLSWISRSYYPFGAGLTSVGVTMSTAGSKSQIEMSGLAATTSIPAARLETGSTLNSLSSYYSPYGYVKRGSVAGSGGFHFRTRVSPSTAAGACTWFAGLGTQTAPAGEASALLNMVGIGVRSTDTNLQLFCNDGSGTATALNLGASFPGRNSSAVYYLELSCDPQGTAIEYTVTREDTGSTTSGSLSTDIPTADTGLSPIIYVNTLSSGAIKNILFYGFTLLGQ